MVDNQFFPLFRSSIEQIGNDISKFLGAGISEFTYTRISPELPSKIWSELDTVPMVFRPGLHYPVANADDATVDEQADTMARKCIMYEANGCWWIDILLTALGILDRVNSPGLNWVLGTRWRLILAGLLFSLA